MRTGWFTFFYLHVPRTCGTWATTPSLKQRRVGTPHISLLSQKPPGLRARAAIGTFLLLLLPPPSFPGRFATFFFEGLRLMAARQDRHHRFRAFPDWRWPLLAGEAEITLFEANDCFGGHRTPST